MPNGLALESNHWFGPEDIAGLTTAFEAALAKLIESTLRAVLQRNVFLRGRPARQLHGRYVDRRHLSRKHGQPSKTKTGKGATSTNQPW